MSEMADAIRALSAEKGIDETSIRQTIERTIVAAYQKSFGKGYENCIVKFADDLSDVSVYARKTVVDGVYDPVIEIELDDAKKLVPEAAVHDTLDIPLDPKKDFHRGAVSVGKQEAHKDLSENSSRKLMDEYRQKLGQIIIGYFLREHKGNIYVELGKVEGVLPQKFQNPREVYDKKNNRIRALIKDVKKVQSGIQIVLSRTDENLVRRLIELEVPEILDETISIKGISREAGYRTKIAVATNKSDVDPVGACVGLKGVRIQNVIRELEGEKIDVLRYDEDPHVFIKNALSPAEVKQVVIKDSEKREALAVVNEDQFSIAIGKQGQNVRLANRLCNWTIDVKTESQVSAEDLAENDSRRAAEELFSTPETYDEILTVAQLPGIKPELAEALRKTGYDDIEKFVSAYDAGTLDNLENVAKEDLDEVYKIIGENVEFEDEDEEAAGQPQEESAEEEEVYYCPDCGEKITPDMTRCPKCGVEFSFEEE
jgi:N utilization substance protein A